MTINATRIRSFEDEHGPIYIYQSRSSRILSFDGHVEQSCMNLKNPLQLMHRYTQAMMTAFLFKPDAEDIIMMGLGAGSMAKSILQHFPDADLHAVEFRQLVIEIAQQYFNVPDSPRLHLYNDDAVHFMRLSRMSNCDIIFSDLYNSNGMEPRQMQQTYLRNCKKALSADGILVLNLWHQDFNHLKQIENFMSADFGDRILSFQVEGGNTIVLAFKSEYPEFERKALLQRAKQMQQTTEIPFEKYAKLIWSLHGDRLKPA